MQYRSRTEIMATILEAANGQWTTKTKLMYRAFLSYAQLKEYFTLLTEKELINYDIKKRMFLTTEKGQRFLQTYGEIKDMVQ